jgi:hypothetical protein
VIEGEAELRNDPVQLERIEMAERYAREMARNDGGIDDSLTIEAQHVFTPAEFADLVFAVGYHIGMQHVSRALHWDDSCPVPVVREQQEH